MKNHSGGSHNNMARPDEKINRELPKKSMMERAITSTQNKIMKRVASKKRRQRDDRDHLDQ